MKTPREAYKTTADAMLDAGKAWLKDHPDADLSFKSAWGDNAESEELAGVLARAGNATGGGATLGLAMAAEGRLMQLQKDANGRQP